MYSDKRRRAVESDIHTGAKVLVKQDREHKLSTPFNASPFKVVEMKGNSVVIESDEGVQYKRNVTHLKKFNERERNCLSNEPKLIENDERVDENCETYPSTNVSCNSESQCSSESVSMSNDKSSETVGVQSRPVRNKKLPSRFEGFSMY